MKGILYRDKKVINMKLNKNKNIWTRDELEEWLGGNREFAHEYVFDIDGYRLVTAAYENEFIKEVEFRFNYETGENTGVSIYRKNRPKGSQKLTPTQRRERELKEILEVFRRFEYDGFRLAFLTFDVDDGEFLSWKDVKALEEENERAEKAYWAKQWKRANGRKEGTA